MFKWKHENFPLSSFYLAAATVPTPLAIRIMPLLRHTTKSGKTKKRRCACNCFRVVHECVFWYRIRCLSINGLMSIRDNNQRKMHSSTQTERSIHVRAHRHWHTYTHTRTNNPIKCLYATDLFDSNDNQMRFVYCTRNRNQRIELNIGWEKCANFFLSPSIVQFV